MLKRFVLILIAGVCLIFTSCNFTGFANIEDSLIPPTLSKNQMEIYNELEKSVGKNIKLKYPNSGDSKNAIIMQDLNNDGIREAIVFYQSTNINAGPNVQVRILSKYDNKWIVSSSFEGAGSEVDKICFGRPSGTDNGYIVIGYNLANKIERRFVIYTYKNSTISIAKTSSYNMFDIMDINEDGKDEIIYIVNDKQNSKPYAYLISQNGNNFNSIGKIETNVDVYEYTKVVQGLVMDGLPAIYLDGKNDENKLSTEIISYVNGKLVNLVYNSKNTELSNQTLREGVNIEDINGDDVYELPQSYVIGDFKDAQLNLTDWFDYQDGRFQRLMSSYVNGTDGYIFSFPDSWTYKMRVTRDSKTGEVVFTTYDASGRENERENIVLKLLTVKRNENSNVLEDYVQVKTNGQLEYYAYIPPTVADKYALDLIQVRKNLITTR